MGHHLDAFELARKITNKSDPMITRYKHGSVLLDRRGKIIAVGRNHFAGGQVDTDEGTICKTMHSETDALRRVNIRRLKDAVIINYARTNVASILARPCDNCWTVLKKLGLKKVFYTIRSELQTPAWVEEYF